VRVCSFVYSHDAHGKYNYNSQEPGDRLTKYRES